MKQILMLEKSEQEQLMKGQLVEVTTPVGILFIGMEISNGEVKHRRITKVTAALRVKKQRNGHGHCPKCNKDFKT